MVCMVDSISVPIRVSRGARDKLKAIGKKGETYDDIIQGLLKRRKR